MDPLLLVLDLDETLIHATFRDLEREPDFLACGYPVYCRPGLSEFIAFCASRYRLGVWTSASHDYAAEIVAATFGETQNQLEFLWSNRRCTQRYTHTYFEPYYVKNLRKLTRRGYAKERILAIDDSPEKWELSYGNYLRVHPFRGDLEDDELTQLMSYLPSLEPHENLRRIEKRRWRGGA